MRIEHFRTYEADKTTGYLEVEGNVLAKTFEDIGRPSHSSWSFTLLFEAT